MQSLRKKTHGTKKKVMKKQVLMDLEVGDEHGGSEVDGIESEEDANFPNDLALNVLDDEAQNARGERVR